MNRLKIFRLLSLIVFLLSLAFIYPTFNFNKLPEWWKFVFPEKKINLGLDLRGGVFVVMGLDENISESIISSKEEQRIKDSILDKNILLRGTSSSNNEIKINFYDQKSAKNAYELLSKKSSYIMSQSENLVTIKLSDDEFTRTQSSKIIESTANSTSISIVEDNAGDILLDLKDFNIDPGSAKINDVKINYKTSKSNFEAYLGEIFYIDENFLKNNFSDCLLYTSDAADE